MINVIGNASPLWKEAGHTNEQDYLFVNSCGYQKFITRDYAVRRSLGRVDYQLIYLLEGKGSYILDNKPLEIPKGHLIVYPPHQPQHYNYSFKDKTELLWLHFSGCGALTELNKNHLLPKQIHYLGTDNRIMDLFHKIIMELQMKKPLYPSFATAYLMELLSMTGRRLADSEKGIVLQQHSDMDKAIALMHAEYNKKFKMEDLAKTINLSMYHFIHKFKETTGITPAAYITNIRIETAKELLSNSNLRIAEVSNVVGYDNPLYFSRVFKRITGSSPSHYRLGTSF